MKRQAEALGLPMADLGVLADLDPDTELLLRRR
jgi:hypothetical protein